jgi:hypothetical protein
MRSLWWLVSVWGGTLRGMSVRVSVQADSEDECAEALARLVGVGFVPVLTPRFMTDGRWLARAVPAPAGLGREPAER